MSSMPTGTVTFLFTDVEGSTRLWSEDPEAMREAIAHHDEVLGGAIGAAGGSVFATGGDSFAAAFQRTGQAVEAAIAAQLAMQGAQQGVEPLRVRMGIHTGRAVERADNYFGPVVNETARLMAPAHGGQILISEAAVAATADRPIEAGFIDLGEHRLKDVDRSMRLFQVTHDGLRVDFPPLRTTVATPHNLPRPLAGLIGRAEALDSVESLLSDARLVTLTGPGGAGKTSLAIACGHAVLDRFPDGVWFCDLAPVTDQVVDTVSDTLKLRTGSIDDLAQHLADRRTLLILDNCEHLLDDAAALVADLLQRTDRVAVLATSRRPLGVVGEQPYPVPMLAVPAQLDAADAAEYPAVALFTERARAVAPGFVITGRNAATVAAICARLDGLPLALELAASRLNVLAPQELLDRLDDHLLTGGTSRTLTATLDWSHDLLDTQEQALFRRLGVFAGGFTMEAAEAVCPYGGIAADVVLDAMSGLVDQSLVVATETERGLRRFYLLETIREYALARLEDAGEADELRRRHAGYFAQLAVDSFDAVRGPKEAGWLDRLDHDWPNIIRALQWHFDNGATEQGLLAAGSLYRYALVQQREGGLTSWLDRFLVADREPSRARARALLARASLSAVFDPLAFYPEAISLYRELGPDAELQAALNNASAAAMGVGDWGSARDLLAEAVELARQTDSPAVLPMALGNQAIVMAQSNGDPAAALALAEESLRWARQLDSAETVAGTLLTLARLHRQHGDLEAAAMVLAEASSLEAMLTPASNAMVLGSLAALALDSGDLDRARRHLLEQAELIRPIAAQDPEWWAYGPVPMLEWARLAAARQQLADAVTMLAADEVRQTQAGQVERPAEAAERSRVLEAAQGQLSADAYGRARDDGIAMGVEAAYDFAVAAVGR